jgi:hypothetical protein
MWVLEFIHSLIMIRYLRNASMNIGGVVPATTTFSTPTDGRCASGCYNQSDLYPDMRTTVAAVYIKYTSGGAGWYQVIC